MSSYNEFFDDDDFDNEFTNELFEGLNMPFIFPNPKEYGADSVGNADIMQPCLLSLQPSIDEINSVTGLELNPVDVQIMQQEQVPQNLQIPPYRPKEYKEYKEYDTNLMQMEYRNPQPTRQSSAVSQNVLMSTQMSQPLYSRAIYDSVVQLQPSPQPFSNEDSSGRASSTTFGAPTPQPQSYMPAHIIAAVSGSTVIQPSPNQVFNGSQTSSPFSNQESNTFRNKFIMENNLHHQQPHQFWISTQQHYQQLQNEHNRRTIQMLQSQAPPQSPLGISPGMSMSNGNMQFGSPLLNLSNANTNSITNLIQQNQIMPTQSVHLMPGSNSPLGRYLAPNSNIHQQSRSTPPQQPQISGMVVKPNDNLLGYSRHNGFSQIKIEKPFIKQQMDSEMPTDIYRPNPSSVEPATALSFSPTVPGFQTLRSEPQSAPQIFRVRFLILCFK